MHVNKHMIGNGINVYFLNKSISMMGQERQRLVMNAHNLIYVLRNYLAQEAIDDLEKGDVEPLEKLRYVLKQPYTLQDNTEQFTQLRPQWVRTRPGCSMLSCSS